MLRKEGSHMESAFIGTQKCIANEKCEFVHISDKYLRLVGYSRQEIRDQFHNSFFEMVYPEDLDTLRENFSRAAFVVRQLFDRLPGADKSWKTHLATRPGKAGYGRRRGFLLL